LGRRATCFAISARLGGRAFDLMSELKGLCAFKTRCVKQLVCDTSPCSGKIRYNPFTVCPPFPFSFFSKYRYLRGCLPALESAFPKLTSSSPKSFGLLEFCLAQPALNSRSGPVWCTEPESFNPETLSKIAARFRITKLSGLAAKTQRRPWSGTGVGAGELGSHKS
jgi:hypothetical protein